MASPSLIGLKLRALLPWDKTTPHHLGALYATGDGVAKDEAAALRWYGVGARRGDAESQYDLGFMILLGEGVAPQPEEALRWLRSAAALGCRRAASLLADLHRHGVHGVPVDEAEARRWEARYAALPGV